LKRHDHRSLLFSKIYISGVKNRTVCWQYQVSSRFSGNGDFAWGWKITQAMLGTGW
jgi:hypothetical protein